jgi:hypothetical protein
MPGRALPAPLPKIGIPPYTVITLLSDHNQPATQTRPRQVLMGLAYLFEKQPSLHEIIQVIECGLTGDGTQANKGTIQWLQASSTPSRQT